MLVHLLWLPRDLAPKSLWHQGTGTHTASSGPWPRCWHCCTSRAVEQPPLPKGKTHDRGDVVKPEPLPDSWLGMCSAWLLCGGSTAAGKMTRGCKTAISRAVGSPKRVHHCGSCQGNRCPESWDIFPVGAGLDCALGLPAPSAMCRLTSPFQRAGEVSLRDSNPSHQLCSSRTPAVARGFIRSLAGQ